MELLRERSNLYASLLGTSVFVYQAVKFLHFETPEIKQSNGTHVEMFHLVGYTQQVTSVHFKSC